MRTLRGAPLAPDVPYLVFGAALTAGAAFWATKHGGALSLGLLLGLLAWILLVAAFVTVPHVAVAFTIPYFTVLPMLKTVVSPTLGPTKDIMIGAAAVAGVILSIQRKRDGAASATDPVTLGAAFLFMALYLIDIGAGVSGADR